MAIADRAPEQHDWYNHDLTVSFEAQPLTLSIRQIDPPKFISTEGADQVITGSATNMYGGTASTSITTDLDKTAPATTASLSDTTDAWLKSVVLTFLPTDGLSGVSKTEYSVDDGGTWNNYIGPITVTSDGRYAVLYRSTDMAGNIEGISKWGY